MSKIGLIIKREYTTRVKKKSFIVMTILGPILFASLMILPAVLMQLEDDEFKRIAVIDETGVFVNSLTNTEYIEFYDFSGRYFDQKTFTYDVTKATDDLKDTWAITASVAGFNVSNVLPLWLGVHRPPMKHSV